jgi:hypothetical protein
MADNSGAGVGLGMIAGILIVALLAVGLVIYLNGGLNLKAART